MNRIESVEPPRPRPAPNPAPNPAQPLAGRRVLVVEDEALVALDLEMTLQAAGAEVVGPCMRLSRALDVIETCAVEARDIDLAILDIRLGREESYPIADRLHARGVAIVFHSGHADIRDLCERYPGAGSCPKPCTPATVIRTLVQATSGGAGLER